MTTNFEADRPVADLGELKSALRDMQLPAAEETAIRSAFRARQRALAEASATRATARSRRPALLAVAAGVVAAITAVVIVGSGERQTSEAPAPQATAAAGTAPDAGITAFQPLMFSPGFTPSSSYSVVRVRIPLSALALVPGHTADGMIEADLLIGEDGLARGIRFNPAAAMLAAAASQE